ncbi:MAG: beta-ketoacyl synthase N-terminal-like domain-containing protein, partial [Actinomycetota bacterium]
MSTSVVVAAARTAIGKFGGAVSSVPAVDLGGVAIEGALKRAGIGTEHVDYVIMGQVLQAGAGQITARQAAVRAGIPLTTPAITINKVCLSGLNAIALADQLIRAGEVSVVVAGGMESMSRAPHLLPGARAGFRLGDATLVDALVHDGLWCAFDGVHMGAGTETYAKAASISRRAQDELAARSHE